MTAPKQLKRRKWPGAILRSLGHASWAAEQTATGINFLGSRYQAPFSSWAGPAQITSTLGFTTIEVPMAGGQNARLAGATPHDAAGFISAANEAFRAHFLKQFETAQSELTALSEVIARLGQPRRYPAACLLSLFLSRATTVIGSLPETIPDGVLSEDQQKLIEIVRAFQEHPDEASPYRHPTLHRFRPCRREGFFRHNREKPAHPEQRLAVVTDEDATLVLAGAGSGKNSVIVSKAAYLVERGIRKPDEILLLAFGKDAASEMADRIKERAGVDVDARTFHALGNRIIREVEGKGPALADHASDDAKFRVLLRDILLNEVASKAGLGKLILDWFSEFYWPYKSEWDFKTQDSYFQWVGRMGRNDHGRSKRRIGGISGFKRSSNAISSATSRCSRRFPLVDRATCALTAG